MKKAERKAEILRKANERLANRTPLDRERSAYTYYGRHPDAVFRKNKCDTIEQAFLSISELDIARQYAGEKTFFRNGNLRYKGRSSAGANGSTDMRGNIFLSCEVERGVKSLFKKLADGRPGDITNDEARSVVTMWHEITHNRHNIDFFHPKNEHLGGYNSKSMKTMEMMNEYVARRTLPEFYRMLGLKNVPFPEFMENRGNCGYDQWVVRLRFSLKYFGADESEFLERAKAGLLEGAYAKQADLAADNLVQTIPALKKSEAKTIVYQCIEFDEYYNPILRRRLSFESDVLEPIRARMTTDRLAKKKAKER